MSLRPLGNRVLVKIKEAVSKTPGGLFIPDSAQEKPLEGTVVSAGPGRVTDSGNFIETTVKKGNTVLLPKYSGTEIQLGGVTHTIISEDDIIGVLDSE